MWKHYFPHAKIVGVDINPNCARFAEDRIAVEIGSQDDPEFLDRVMRQYQPLVVVDDGSHLAHHIITSFERIFPMLRPGGIYIIEDTACHFGPTAPVHQALSRVTLHDYFMPLAVNNLAIRIEPNADHGFGKCVFTNLESIGFVKGAIVMRKTSPLIDEATATRIAEAFVGGSRLPSHQAGLAGIHFARGSLEQAEAAIRLAVEGAPDMASYHYHHGEILRQMGRGDEAIAALRQALRTPTGWTIGNSPGNAWYYLGLLYTKKGNHADAVDSFEQAVASYPNHAPNREALSYALEGLGNLAEAIAQAELAIRFSDAADAERHERRIADLKQRLLATIPPR